MTETAPSAETLAKVLDAEGLPDLAERARRNEFHDFLSPHAVPESVLATALMMRARNALAVRVMRGEFDATPEEAQAWQQSEEGQESLRELGSIAAAVMGLPPDHPAWRDVAEAQRKADGRNG